MLNKWLLTHEQRPTHGYVLNTAATDALAISIHSADWIFIVLDQFTQNITTTWNNIKLEQLERLRSEVPPRRPMITHTSDSHIRSQVKTRRSQSCKFNKIAKNSDFKILQRKFSTRHTFWSCLIRYGSNQNCRCYRADTGCGTDEQMDGQTDRQTDKVKPIYPQQLRCAGGIKINLPFEKKKNNCCLRVEICKNWLSSHL